MMLHVPVNALAANAAMAVIIMRPIMFVKQMQTGNTAVPGVMSAEKM